MYVVIHLQICRSKSPPVYFWCNITYPRKNTSSTHGRWNQESKGDNCPPKFEQNNGNCMFYQCKILGKLIPQPPSPNGPHTHMPVQPSLKCSNCKGWGSMPTMTKHVVLIKTHYRLCQIRINLHLLYRK